MASKGHCEPLWLPAFLVPETTLSWEGSWDCLSWESFLLTRCRGAACPGLPLWPLHTGSSLHTAVTAFTLGIRASQGQGRPLPRARHRARPLRAASHCESGPESRLQKDKTKASPAGSWASTGEPGYPPGLAGQLLRPGSVGRVSEPIAAAPSLAPSTATWPNPSLRELGRPACQGRLLPFSSRCSGCLGERETSERMMEGGEGRGSGDSLGREMGR